jgi:hypothetical protein
MPWNLRPLIKEHDILAQLAQVTTSANASIKAIRACLSGVILVRGK